MIPPMKLSVVVCTYNGARFIDEQIGSIINQTLKPNQIVISDDGSTDNTWEKLQQWQSHYPEIIELYRHPNNVGFNRNFSFALSKVNGDYVALCDQDDVWYENKLSVLSQYATNYPNISLFQHSEDIMVETKKSRNEDSRVVSHWKSYEGSGCGILFVLNRLTGHLLFFKTSLLQYILPIPSNVIYDWWINVIVGIKGTTKFVPEKLMAYRLHDNSAYFSDVDKHLKDVTVPVRNALAHFSRIEGMTDKDLYYLKHFKKYYAKHRPNKFDWQLFLFFYKNRKELFRDFYVSGSSLYRSFFLIRLCRAFSKW